MADGGDGHDVVEIPAGYDLGSIEVVLARLRGDGIEVRLEPDESGMIPDDESGYRLLLHPADLEAARPVLEAADIAVP
jgi:hypothetical protein